MPVSEAPTSPTSTQERRTRLPGWKAILVQDETLARPQSIQASTVDPHLDPRYLVDAAVLTALDVVQDGAIAKRADQQMQRHL